MTIEASYLGAKAEAEVVSRLVGNGWPVFVDIVPCNIDLVSQAPCKHLVSFQVKLANQQYGKNPSFHTGDYEDVDFYAVVWYNGLTPFYTPVIVWIPTEHIEASSHASLTGELKDLFVREVPWCKQCGESS